MFYTIPMLWGSYGCCFTPSPCHEVAMGVLHCPHVSSGGTAAVYLRSLWFASRDIRGCQEPPQPHETFGPWAARPALPRAHAAPALLRLPPARSGFYGCRLRPPHQHGLHRPPPQRLHAGNFTARLQHAAALRGAGQWGTVALVTSLVECWRPYRREFSWGMLEGLQKGIQLGDVGGHTEGNSVVGCWRAYRREFSCGMLEGLQKGIQLWDVGGLTEGNSLVGRWRAYRREFTCGTLEGLQKGNSLLGCWRAYRGELTCGMLEGIQRGINLWDVGGLTKGINFWDVGGLTKGNSVMGCWRALKKVIQLWDVGGLTEGNSLVGCWRVYKKNSVVGCGRALRREFTCGLLEGFKKGNYLWAIGGL